MSAASALALFAAMWIGWVQSWPWLTAVDNWFLNGLYSVAKAHPAWVTCWNVFCTVLGPSAFRAVGVALIIWLLARRYLRLALFLVLSVETAGLLTVTMKYLANRPRPSTAMVDALGTSFPSGHAVGVTASVLALLTVESAFLAPRWQAALTVLGVVIVLAIGFGRVALNVHHPSDVLAGWAMGYLWYLFCLLVVRPLPLNRTGVSVPVETPATPGSGS
ncbi:phosphatase PAP2 family protein [soil metagenome]